MYWIAMQKFLLAVSLAFRSQLSHDLSAFGLYHRMNSELIFHSGCRILCDGNRLQGRTACKTLPGRTCEDELHQKESRNGE